MADTACHALQEIGTPWLLLESVSGQEYGLDCRGRAHGRDIALRVGLNAARDCE